MKTHMYISAAVLLLILTASGCNATDDGMLFWGDGIEGSGTISNDVRRFEDLKGVHLATVGELRVELGDRNELEITTDNNLIKYFNTTVKDGILRIDIESGISISPSSGVQYHLVVKSLESVRASSSGDILVKAIDNPNVDIGLSSSGDIRVRDLKGERVRLSLSSSGDLEILSLSARELTASLSSSGDCTIKRGRTEQQEVSISSSGDYQAEGLESSQAIVRSSSSGDARVWVTDRLRAATSSSGDIHFRGNPRVEARESSSGDVQRIH